MSVKLRAEFAIRGWDESPIDPGTGVSKLTEALVEKIYSGDIEGTSVTNGSWRTRRIRLRCSLVWSGSEARSLAGTGA